MLEGVGRGGRCAPPRRTRVKGHQMRRTTTMTVVTCMMRSAFVLDSGTPFMLLNQKYTVTATLKNTANQFGFVRQLWCSAALISFSSEPRYRPALTTLIGPVRT